LFQLEYMDIKLKYVHVSAIVGESK
jgi:hypothetical protein